MIELASEMLRMVSRSVTVRSRGLKKYPGNDEKICKAIIDKCFNKDQQYFMVSAGHFSQFYVRDFGLCTESLMKLGYVEEVHKTLQYALSCFSRHHRITTQITPKGVPINSYAQPTDSLPFFLRSLRLGKAHDLVEVYKPFLENKVFEYKNAVFDRKTQLVKRNMYFSSIKDGFKRDSSCYDNCCVAALSNELNLLKLKNPFRNHDFKRIINQNFWNGKYYYDDLSKEDYVAADANIFPYYFGIINDKKKLASSIQAIQKEKLDDPMPIKYTNFRDPKKQILVQKLFTPNYEGTTVWIHLGLAYMCVVAKHDKVLLRKYLEEYKNQMILKYNNFLEVLNPDTTPYKSAVYFCDDSMSWASIYLNLKNHA